MSVILFFSQRVVDKVVQIPVLHMFFGEIDPKNKDVDGINLFYFTRTSDESIPEFETFQACNERITRYLMVGSVNGKLLSCLNKILIHVSSMVFTSTIIIH